VIGLMLHTHHFGNVPCDDTVGVYVVHEQVGGGVFRNSECRVGAWGGWAPETNTITLGPAKVKAGLIAGLVLGYRHRPVFPLLVPSAAVSLDGRHWLRANVLPPFRETTAGVMLSVEWNF
jgi:hypothetical protein